METIIINPDRYLAQLKDFAVAQLPADRNRRRGNSMCIGCMNGQHCLNSDCLCLCNEPQGHPV